MSVPFSLVSESKLAFETFTGVILSFWALGIRLKGIYIIVHSVFLAVWWLLLPESLEIEVSNLNDIGECFEFCARLCTPEQNYSIYNSFSNREHLISCFSGFKMFQIKWPTEIDQ